MLKAEELIALNYIQRGYPPPRSLAWINRGTGQVLRPTTVEMLVRTLFTRPDTPSVRKLHKNSGLRVSFASDSDREQFRNLFAEARDRWAQQRKSELIAFFDEPARAEKALQRLAKVGVDPQAVSVLWRAGQFIRSSHDNARGHSKASVALASASGGLGGALFGVTLLLVPGFGLMAAGGLAASQALGTIGALGGALGATGGAIARMLTDMDVDGREIPFFERGIREGKVFIAVDPVRGRVSVDEIRTVLEGCRAEFFSDGT